MRKLPGMVSMIVLALVLVACGGDGDDEEATATVAPTVAVVATEAEPTTPASTPAPASPVSGTPMVEASPPGFATPLPGSTPVVDVATPAVATPAVATPATAVASPESGEGLAVPVGIDGEGSGETQLLTGLVTLPGTANERFVIGDDGCIGLGTYAGLQAGQQVIVRDGAGAIIGVGNLSATGSAVVCSWTFEIEVPASEFYEVSIPMRAEQVYSQDEVVASGGQIELTLP